MTNELRLKGVEQRTHRHTASDGRTGISTKAILIETFWLHRICLDGAGLWVRGVALWADLILFWKGWAKLSRYSAYCPVLWYMELKGK